MGTGKNRLTGTGVKVVVRHIELAEMHYLICPVRMLGPGDPAKEAIKTESRL